VLVASPEDKRACELALKAAELKCPLPLDQHVFTKREMLTMLKDREENLGSR